VIAGVFYFAKKYIPKGYTYTTLLMSTGLTFGTISSLFGYNAGYINQVQYSLLIGVVIASAVIPTFIAQRWFMPKHTEDIETEEEEEQKPNAIDIGQSLLSAHGQQMPFGQQEL